MRSGKRAYAFRVGGREQQRSDGAGERAKGNEGSSDDSYLMARAFSPSSAQVDSTVLVWYTVGTTMVLTNTGWPDSEKSFRLGSTIREGRLASSDKCPFSPRYFRALLSK